MLSETKLKSIQDFTSTLTRDEIIWLNGYLAGLAGPVQPLVGGTSATPPPHLNGKTPQTKKITLAYGTETGNAKSLAMQLAGIAKKKNVQVKLVGLDQYRLSDLAREEHFFVVISTQGEGEPPALARKFYDHIHQHEFDLKKMKFGVLALGDSSYAQFCQTGIDVDARLDALGAKRIVPLRKCDVDYEQEALFWLDELANALEPGSSPAPSAPVESVQKKSEGKQMYRGQVVNSINLNDTGSKKKTFHIEIISDDPIDYLPGDSLGVIPSNKPTIVAEILALTGIDPSKVIEHPKMTTTVQELLSGRLNIGYLLKSTIKQYAGIVEKDIPDVRLSLFDLLRQYPLKNPEQFEEVLKLLTIQAPRLYSISSSPEAHGDREVHITVTVDKFFVGEQMRSGVGSRYLSLLEPESSFEFFIQKSKHFKLPADEKDVIMVGPGTGIAAFRSFLAEREARSASGRNWLFFGEQHFLSDFLYQTEIQYFLESGVLQQLDLAFSRDQKEKIYVQHRMKEKGAELFRWLEGGASFYVSGKRDPMSKDVEEALLEIIREFGGKTETEARDYLKKLSDEGRYKKDVY